MIKGIKTPDNTIHDLFSKSTGGIVRAVMDDEASTSTAFVLTSDRIDSLYDGLTIVTKNTKVASASGCTINLNSLGAKSIWLSQTNAACTTHWGLNSTYIFIFDYTNDRWELQQGNDNFTEYYGTCINTGAAVAKTATLVNGDNFRLYTGVTVRIKFNDYNSATDPTLNVNNTGAIAIKRLGNTAIGTSIQGSWADGAIVTLTYDGTNWVLNNSNDSTVASSQNAHAEGYNTKASGTNSHAEGYNTTASGTHSHAEGYSATASGNYSHAEGFGYASYAYAHAEGYTPSTTYGANSYAGHAEGYYTKTLGYSNSSSYNLGNHAEGYYTTAGSTSSQDQNKHGAHAEGRYTLATGGGSHAEGYGYSSTRTISATGAGSHAEGYATSSKSVTASATGSHAEGYTTTASAQAAHAEGYNTTASGYYSHAEGYYTTASGGSSHAEGYNTTASGARAHAEGNFTTANHASQHVFGEYNILDDSTASTSSRGNYVEIVGNGIDSTTRSNARTLDWDGNEVLAGGLTATTINNYTLGPACEKDIATSVTSGSTDLVTAGAVYTAIDNLPEPMVFKGSLGTGGTITALPVDGSASVGDTYKVITAGTYAGQAADVGDTFICDSKTSDANTWTLIPSGDDTVADTWRNIKINGTEKLGTGISTGAVDFVNGTGTTASFDTTGSKVSYSVTYGNSANTACQGNDSRLSNARTPTSHTHGNIQNGGTLQTTDITIADGDKLVVTDSSDSSKIARTSIAFDGSTTTKALTQKGTFESLPSSASSATTGISISDHSTTSITGVQSSTTTASKVTLGTAISVPNVTSAGSASNWVFEDITVPKAASTATSIPNVTAVGSGSFTSGAFDGGSGTFTATVTNGTLSFSHTHTAATHGADSHTHTAPTLGTAISVTGVSGSTTASHVKSGGNGTAPTLGTAISIPNVTGATDVTVPIKNTSSTTVVTSKTHTVTDNGHTHTLS